MKVIRLWYQTVKKPLSIESGLQVIRLYLLLMDGKDIGLADGSMMMIIHIGKKNG